MLRWSSVTRLDVILLSSTGPDIPVERPASGRAKYGHIIQVEICSTKGSFYAVLLLLLPSTDDSIKEVIDDAKDSHGSSSPDEGRNTGEESSLFRALGLGFNTRLV